MVVVGLYLLRMFIFMLIASPIVLFCRIHKVRHGTEGGIRTTPQHEVGVYVLIFFLVGFASVTVIPRLAMREVGLVILGSGLQDFNLVPFRSIAECFAELFKGHLRYFMINFWGNILVFVPIGFALPLLWERWEHPGRAVGICFLITLATELIQFPMQRHSDIDDLILNTLGGLLGYLCYLAVRRLAPVFAGHCKMMREE